MIDLGPGAGSARRAAPLRRHAARARARARSATGELLRRADRGRRRAPEAPPGAARRPPRRVSAGGGRDHDPRRAGAQPEEPDRPHPARPPRRRLGRLGLRQVDARARHPLQRVRAPRQGRRCSSTSARTTRIEGLDERRRRPSRGPEPARPLGAVEPGHVHEGLGRDPPGLRATAPRGARLTARDFSFNASGGRCEACKGTGWQTIDMQFLADVTVRCDVCDGAPLPEPRARGALPRQEHRRPARDDGRGRGRVLRRRGEDRAPPAAARRRRASGT